MRNLLRALWPVLVVVGGAVTCDNPTGPKPAFIAIAPRLNISSIREFAGLTVDAARLIVIRPSTGDTLADKTFPFSVDSATLDVSLAVDVTGSEQLDVTIKLLAGSQVVFTGTTTVTATAGATSQAPAPVNVNYSGPGASIASIQVSPRDSGAAFGATVPFKVTALDSANNPINNFYIGWRSSDEKVGFVNAVGLFTARSKRGIVWVSAHTPTGIWDSTRMAVTPVASAVQVVSGDGQAGSTGATLGQPLVVRVIAADNLPVVGAVVTFTAPAGGSVSPTTAATDTTGKAQTIATLGNGSGNETFTASVSGATPAQFTMNAFAGGAQKLAFTTNPANSTAGVAIPSVVVQVEDAGNNLVNTFNGNVTIALSGNPTGASLLGTNTVAAVNGIATFAGLTINLASSGYVMRATSGTLTAGVSGAFSISAAAAVALTKSAGDNQVALAGDTLPARPQVKVADSFGNGVPAVGVQFAVASGGGSIANANATTNAAGLATLAGVTGWRLGAANGANTLTASVPSIGTIPAVTFSATAASPGTMTLSPHLDTMTAIGDTFALLAVNHNTLGGVIPGVFTWVSRTPATATVDTAGRVAAVSNGSTYVVATEAGGSKDSALIVVQQRIATVHVTPSTRSIYLTRNFTFTAAAVDGRNHPVPGTPTFTWSSTAPSVATVDTAGHVLAVGLGSAQIRAAVGSVIGVANISVITPVTAINVVIDTVGAFKTDTFAMASLGLTRRYRAIAHDTIGNVMSGLTFTWASSNGSVAVMNTVTGDTASVTSAANGLTQVNATAQGFTSAPGASLTVAQVLGSIVLSPPPANPGANIGIGGTLAMQARGKDANNRFISGGSFSFASDTPAVATIDVNTGVVTGLANGFTNITATSGAITSNKVVVAVGGGNVPALLSFGRDTLSVGRGSSTSIPIFLSKPAAAPLVVKLTVADTFAFWSTATVTIPQGQTSVNATLNGHNAGTTTVTATDTTGVYAATTSVLAVTATMHLTSGSYAVNATDVVPTQVLLSDPSPAGGTYVTFSFGTAGIAAISPDPAFIPAGQLAADIQIRAIGTGNTTITPSAIGVNGTASFFQAYAPVLTPTSSFTRLGAGQYESGNYVYTPTTTNTAIPVTIATSDSNVATASSPLTIPKNSYYAYYTVLAQAPGAAALAFSAPGWTVANGINVQVTTPHVGVCCNNSGLFTTSPIQTLTIYAEDSAGSGHYRSNSLVVRLSSSDTTVIKVMDSVTTIAPGTYYTFPRVQVAGVGGSAYLRATASGHTPDSVLYTVQGPPLAFSWFGTPRIGAGQEDRSAYYVYVPNSVTTALKVAIANSDTTVISVPDTLTIPVGSYYAYFPVVRAKTPGTATLTATAPGYNNVTGSFVVTSPRLFVCCNYQLNNFGPGQNIVVYAEDSVRSAHTRTTPLAVSIVSTDPSVVTVDSSSVTIDSGQYYNSRAHLTPVSVGTAQIIVSAAGHPALDTLTITVVQPQVQFSFFQQVLGRRQHFDPNNNGFYIYVPNNRTSPLIATITQLHPSVDSLTSTVDTIPAGTYYHYLDAYGLATGTDTLIVSAPGYATDSAFVVVSTPHLYTCCLGGTTTTTNPPLGVTVYTTDSLFSGHYSMDTLVVAAVSSDTTVLRPAQPFFRILKNAFYAQPSINVVGPGTASITFSDSAGTGYLPITTNVVTVTGPSLAIAAFGSTLGMRQHAGVNTSYVYVPNAVATPLVVHLVSTGTRVVTVPDSIIMATGLYYAYFDVTAQDTVGTIQIQATATGYQATSFNVQVTVPKFQVATNTSINTTSARQTLTIYAEDANGSSHPTTEDVFVTLLSSAPGVAVVDSSTVTIQQDHSYTQAAGWTPGQVGTSLITATDPRAALYHYGTGSVSVAVNTPNLSFDWNTSYLGIGQYIDYHYAYVPDYATAPIAVSFTHTGTAHTGTFDNLTNNPNSGVTIPINSYYQYFRLLGVSTGTDTLVASATSPAHNPATAYTVVGNGRIDPLAGFPAAMNAGDSVLITLYARDPQQGAHYVVAATTFNLSSNANVEFRSGGSTSSVITQATIPADAQFIQFWMKAKTTGTGSVTITATNYTTYTNTVTVQ